MRATWNGAVIAESDRTVRLEGNHYFPIADVDQGFLRRSGTHTTCPWKGKASYYSISVNGAVLRDGAWYYPSPSSAAEEIAGHVAFWHGVRVERVREAGPAADASDRPATKRRVLARWRQRVGLSG